jgi:hypothetical protein
VEVWRPDAEIVRIIRWKGPSLEVDQHSVDVWIEAQLSRASPEGRAERRRQLEAYPVNETFPAFYSLMTDRDGNAWLPAWVRPGQASAPQWTVLTAGGQLLARVRMPAGLKPLEIGLDYVVGTTGDELGVQHMVCHRLERRASGG